MILTAPDDENEPATERLLRPQHGMHRFEWPPDPGVEFHISPGDWIRLLRANGFEVEDLIEVYPPDGATTRYPYMSLAWAQAGPARRSGRRASAPADGDFAAQHCLERRPVC